MRFGWTVWAILTLTGAGVACQGGDVFVCISDDDCNSKMNGQCEPTQYCSFPDDACATGRRYGEAAGEGLSRRCVPAEHQTGTETEAVSTTAIPPTSTSTSSTTSGSATTTPASATAPATSTTFPVTTNDDSSTTWGPTWGDTSSGSSSGDESGSSTGDPVPCEIVIQDEFDMPSLATHWRTEATNYALVDGALEFDISLEDDGYTFIMSDNAFSGESLTVRWVVEDLPDLDFTQQVVALSRIGSDESLNLLIDTEGLVARHWENDVDFMELAEFSPEAVGPWLQMRVAGPQVFFEQSNDGAVFETLYTYDYDIRDWDVEIWLGGGNWMPNVADESISFGAAAVCAVTMG